MTANLGWITPLQGMLSLSQMFSAGGSACQTPIVMPTLRHPDVPDVHAAILTKEMLHRSELVFPPLNALSTLGNLAMTVAAYLNRDSPEAAAKLPWLAASFGLSVGVTLYTLTIMVPRNGVMVASAEKLKKDSEDEEAKRTLRKTQGDWQKYNIGRGILMMSSAITSLLGLVAV